MITICFTALKRWGAPNVIPDHLDGAPSYNIASYLKKLKQQVSPSQPPSTPHYHGAEFLPGRANWKWIGCRQQPNNRKTLPYHWYFHDGGGDGGVGTDGV